MKIIKQTKHCKLIELTEQELKEGAIMGLLETGKSHKPTSNDEKKQLIGDAVCKINTIKKYVKENETEERLLIELEVINAIPDPKGRETTIVYGDKITKYYKETGGKKTNFEAFFNDMFTAGIDIDTDSEESLELSLTDAVNKLVYVRSWVSEFVGNDGTDVIYQNSVIKTSKMITPENSTPQIPY